MTHALALTWFVVSVALAVACFAAAFFFRHHQNRRDRHHA